MASDFFLKFDDFHKFESFEDAAEAAAHALRRLGGNSVDLGDGFLKLIHDGTSVAGEGVSPDALDIKLKHDDALVSADFLKVGLDFFKASDAQHKIDTHEIVIIKQIDVASPLLFSDSSAGGGGAAQVATDLASYEADLKITGTDFLKVAPGIADAPSESLSLDYNSISIDYKQQGADLHKISADFFALARSASDLKLGGLSDAAIKYADDAATLAADYLKVSADFQKISQDFAPNLDLKIATGPSFNQGVLQNSADFIKLAGDLKFVNADYKVLAGDTLKLADTLEGAAHLLPAVQKS